MGSEAGSVPVVRQAYRAILVTSSVQPVIQTWSSYSWHVQFLWSWKTGWVSWSLSSLGSFSGRHFWFFLCFGIEIPSLRSTVQCSDILLWCCFPVPNFPHFQWNGIPHSPPGSSQGTSKNKAQKISVSLGWLLLMIHPMFYCIVQGLCWFHIQHKVVFIYTVSASSGEWLLDALDCNRILSWIWWETGEVFWCVEKTKREKEKFSFQNDKKFLLSLKNKLCTHRLSFWYLPLLWYINLVCQLHFPTKRHFQLQCVHLDTPFPEC